MISRLNLRTRIACTRNALEKNNEKPTVVDDVFIIKETTGLVCRNLVIVGNPKAFWGHTSVPNTAYYESYLAQVHTPDVPERVIGKRGTTVEHYQEQ